MFFFKADVCDDKQEKKKVGAAQCGTNNIEFTLLMYDRMPLTQMGSALFRQDSNKHDP